MSGAETLRRAAAAIREEHEPRDGHLFCQCEDSDRWFDRSICPEPCDSMHDICVDCGLVKGYCPVATMKREQGNRLASAWLAVADWLEAEAGRHEVLSADFDTSNCCRMPQALVVARSYLGEDR